MGSPAECSGLCVLPGAETTQQAPLPVPEFMVSWVSGYLLAVHGHAVYLCDGGGEVGAPEESV